MSEAEEELETAVLLRTGIEEGADGKLYGQWVEVTQAEIASAENGVPLDITHRTIRLFAISGAMKGYPGAMYEVPFRTEEDRFIIYPGKARFYKLWPVDAQRAMWTAQARAIEAELNAKARVKKAIKSNPMYEQLKPIRDAYHKAIGAQRAYLIADVVAYITGSGK